MVLYWHVWDRSGNARKYMDQVTYNGVTFTSIFYEAMRRVFFDENRTPGLLYTGAVFDHAKDIICQNGSQYGFNVQQAELMLKVGNYHYLSEHQEILGRGTYHWSQLHIEDRSPHFPLAIANAHGKFTIEFNFWRLVDQAKNDVSMGTAIGSSPGEETDNGVDFCIWYTAATMLHEIMHHHDFHHPTEWRGQNREWKQGTNYASSLPHVAFWSVLRCSPFASWIDGIASSTLELTDGDAGLELGIM